ncbi:flagellar hook-length control protein FliK [Novosphingobium sp. M1R2S20]|uniref:Flagellar hook-length control protein FliK n=1 Tax=Novosphingobium rhizovicinum TaxID=3228928 RepID=A0ABV3R8U1_9SPHN
MEIAATVTPALGASSTGAAASAGSSGFAELLGQVGNGAAQGGALDPSAATRVPFAGPGLSLQAPAQADGAGTPVNMKMQLLTGAAAVPGTPAEAGASALAELPDGSPEAPALATAALALGQDEAKPEGAVKSAAKSAPEPTQPKGEKDALTAPVLSQQQGPLVEAAPAVSVEMVAEAFPNAAPASVEPEESEPAPDGTSAAAKDALWSQVAPSPQTVQSAAVGKAIQPASKELDLPVANGLQAEAPSGESGSGVAANSDAAPEPASEGFARMVTSAAPERIQQQPASATPASLPAGTPAPQAAAQPLPAPQQQPVYLHAATQSHPTVSFRDDKVAREMGLEIARRVSAGGDELVIRLDPAELGRINIRMTVNEHGHLRAVVAADTPSVLDAIRNDISDLNRALEQAGVRTDGQSFRFDRGGSGDSGSQWQQRYQQQQSGNRDNEHTGLATAEDPASYRPMATNGRINMMA